MASRELQLCSRIIQSGNLHDVIEWGITSEDFLTGEGQAIFGMITGYYRQNETAGSVIGVHAAIDKFPTFELCDDAGMSTDALCLEVRRVRMVKVLQKQLKLAMSIAESDPLKAASMARSGASDIIDMGSTRSTDVRMLGALDQIVTEYTMKEDGIDMSCGPWPWEPLNDATDGMQPDDYVVFYGRPKSFKSWVLSYIIAHSYHGGKRALIYTKEMSALNIFKRVTASILEVDYRAFKKAKLTVEERNALFTLQAMIRQSNETQAEQLICLSGQDAPAGGDNVPWLQSKVDTFDPDYVFVDGLYLLSDTNNAKKREERVSNISRGLRQMQLDTGKPLITTLQANRNAAKHEEANLDELSFSDAIGQDATLVLRVINEQTGPTVQVVVGGARECDLNGFRINAVPATDFTYHSALTDKDINKATDKDNEEREKDKHAAKKKRGKTKTYSAGSRIDAM